MCQFKIWQLKINGKNTLYFFFFLVKGQEEDVGERESHAGEKLKYWKWKGLWFLCK